MVELAERARQMSKGGYEWTLSFTNNPENFIVMRTLFVV